MTLIKEFSENACSSVKRAFVLGNGPSLSKVNLECLRGEFTVGVNRILFSGFEPNVICITDILCLDKQNMDMINQSESQLVFGLRAYEAFKENGYDIRDRLLIVGDELSPPALKPFDLYAYDRLYERNFRTRVCGSIVGDLAIPLAIFLGIKKIYLLGVDGYWSFTHGRTQHFYNSDNQYKDIALERARRTQGMIKMMFAKMDLLAQQRGVEICNLSPGSAINSFKKIEQSALGLDVFDDKRLNVDNKYVVLGGEIYKLERRIDKPNTSQYFLVNVMSKKVLCHINSKLVESERDELREHFSKSLFWCEKGFTGNHSVSFQSCRPIAHYIVKNPYSGEYVLARLNANFLISESSFDVYGSHDEALSNIDDIQLKS